MSSKKKAGKKKGPTVTSLANALKKQKAEIENLHEQLAALKQRVECGP
jgi:uncharacterized coiled-coil protein SlyX